METIDEGRPQISFVLAVLVGLSWAFIISPAALIFFGGGPVETTLPYSRSPGITDVLSFHNMLILLNWVFLPSTVSLLSARKFGLGEKPSKLAFWCVFAFTLVGTLMWAVS